MGEKNTIAWGQITHENMDQMLYFCFVAKMFVFEKVQSTGTSHPCEWHWLGFLEFTYFEIFKIYAPHMTRDQNLHFYQAKFKTQKYTFDIHEIDKELEGYIELQEYSPASKNIGIIVFCSVVFCFD